MLVYLYAAIPEWHEHIYVFSEIGIQNLFYVDVIFSCCLRFCLFFAAALILPYFGGLPQPPPTTLKSPISRISLET